MKERQKAAKAAAAAYSAGVKAAEDEPSDEATRTEAAFERAMADANKLVQEAQIAANAVKEPLRGQDINLQDQVGQHASVLPIFERVVIQEIVQVDVLLFMRVEEIAAFIANHPELSK